MSSDKYVTLPSGYVHEMRTFDGPRTLDRQLGLTIAAAYSAWENWNSQAPIKIQGISSDFDAAMRYLYRQIRESEVFLSGMAQK